MRTGLPCGGSVGAALTVQVPEDIAQMVEHMSAATGEAPEQLVVSALRTHFAPIPPSLQREFDLWEQASEYDAGRDGPFRGDL